jgi:3-hydroxymyristoyl/3-hydroxydecanoyl-(acyl carrier protein) dehydratase
MEPGDQLFIYVNVLQKSSIMWKFSAEIFINDDKNKKGMEAEFSAFIKSV